MTSIQEYTKGNFSSDQIFREIKKDEIRFLAYVKDIMQSESWQQLLPELQKKIVRKIKKYIVCSNQLSHKVAHIAEKIFFYESAQLKNLLAENRDFEAVNDDFLTLAFYIKLKKLKISDDIQKKINAIDSRSINEKNLLYLLEISGYFDAKVLRRRLLDKYLHNERETLPIELFKNDFLAPEGRELLKKYRDRIFENFPQISNYVTKTFPETKEVHRDLYPVQVIPSIEECKIHIVCFKVQLMDLDNSRDILRKIAHAIQEIHLNWKSSYELRILVSYRNEPTIDYGGVIKDFMTVFFHSLSKKERLYEPISKIENKELRLLGPILMHLLTRQKRNQESFFTGEVFHDSFFKAMVEFTYLQICSAFNDLKEEEVHALLASGYSTQEENERIKSILTILNWDGSPEGNFDSITHLVKFYSESGRYLCMELSHELSRLIEKVAITSFVGRKRKLQASDQPSEKFQKKHSDETVDTNLLKSREALNSSLEEIQAYFKKPHTLDQVKESLSEILMDYKNQLKNIHSILKEMNLSEKDWNDWKSKGAEFLKKSIQGHYNQQALMQKMKFVNLPAAEKNISDWFLHSKETKVRQLLEYATGSPMVPYNDIEIVKGNRLSGITCTNTVEVPDTPEKEYIDLYLDMLAEKGNSSFNAENDPSSEDEIKISLSVLE